MSSNYFYINYLKNELELRCRHNPRYSLRAFARSLGLNIATLSQILSGERPPSVKSLQKILGIASMVPADRARFVSSVTECQRGRNLKRMNPEFRREWPAAGDVLNASEISVDQFRMISDWYHYAILELTELDSFRSDARWIATKLSISTAQAKLALERLVSLGLLKAGARGRLVRTNVFFTTADKSRTTPALKQRQKQVHAMAIASIENDPIEVRDMSSLTIAIDPALLPEAKLRIQNFRRELGDFLTSGKRTRVYELGVALFPLSKPDQKTNQKGKNP